MASPGGEHKATQGLAQVRDPIDEILVYKVYRIIWILEIPLKNTWYLGKIRLLRLQFFK